MINNLSELLKKEIGPELSSKFDLSQEKSSSILETIASTVKDKKGGGDLGTLASGLSSMVSSDSGIGSTIISQLMKKENLSESMAEKIKDFVLPIAMEFIKKKMGSSMGSLTGKTGLSNFKF